MPSREAIESKETSSASSFGQTGRRNVHEKQNRSKKFKEKEFECQTNLTINDQERVQ